VPRGADRGEDGEDGADTPVPSRRAAMPWSSRSVAKYWVSSRGLLRRGERVRGSRTVPRLPRRRRWFLTVAAALLAASPLAGCAATSPQCAKADALRQAGHLTQAKAQYDRATAASEAACADDGRLAVTRLRADLQDALARGRAAESAGHVQAARDAYAAAARVDVDSPEAVAALARVRGAGPTQVPASPVMSPVMSRPRRRPSGRSPPPPPASASGWPSRPWSPWPPSW
jgi:hypothetical protein